MYLVQGIGVSCSVFLVGVTAQSSRWVGLFCGVTVLLFKHCVVKELVIARAEPLLCRCLFLWSTFVCHHFAHTKVFRCCIEPLPASDAPLKIPGRIACVSAGRRPW